MAQRSNNLVGVTGEYFVCAELGKRGILALPPLLLQRMKKQHIS